MLRHELCKLFARPSGKAALLLLAVLVAVSTFFACHVRYTDEEGQTQYGLSAVRQLRADQKAWAGPLDEAQLRRAIQANLDVRTSPDAQSEDVVRQDMAFHRQQAFEAIRDLLNSAYSEDFQAFDYFTADTLTPEDAPDFYANRVRLLQQWLEDNAFAFSQAEQNYLVQQYQALETPMYVDYTTGWQQFYEFSPTVIIILCLFACFLVSGIFSQEGQWKTDAIFFTTFHGRGRGVSAKVGAGLLLLTVLYWVPFLLFGGITLAFLGADGAGCPVQLYAWKSLYNLTLGQGALLIALGGYLGTLFLGLLSMWVSAKSGSTVLAAVLPFAVIFLPALMLGDINTLLSNILGLLPDKLLQINRDLAYFDLYQLGDSVMGAIPILLVLYTVLTLLFIPLLYKTYQHKQLK